MAKTSPIVYRDDVVPSTETIIELYRAAPLNRPLDTPDRIGRLFAGSNLVHSAWVGDRLVGILRGMTDGAFDGYICDLAVLPDFQRCGVGRALLDRVVSANRQVQFVLRASQIARDYYRHIGWTAIENGWFVPREA